MKNYGYILNIIPLLVALMLMVSYTCADTTPPDNPVKLIFIHHSVGENWLSDDNGGLGKTLGENNYFVSDTYYGWGPDAIGDHTDIPDWLEWFSGPDRDTYMNAVYTEYRDDAAGYDYYNRPMADPGGENQIVIFKSCYPNSNLAGNPADPAGEAPDMTVGGAKYVYNQLLDYFKRHPERLFIAITPPPETSPEYAESAESFSRWMTEDWLSDYPGTNVGVFDLHAVLSGTENHHTADGDTVMYTTGHGNTLAYPTEDQHPSKIGNLKATQEFVPLLNYYYNRWMNGNTKPLVLERTRDSPTSEPESGYWENVSHVSENRSQETGTVLTGEKEINGTWVTYDDGQSIISLNTGDRADSFCVETKVIPGGWTSVETLSDKIRDWSGYSGISFMISANREGIPYSLVLYEAEGPEGKTGYSVARTTGPDSRGTGELVSIPWSDFSPMEGTGVFNPKLGKGLFFAFESGDGNQERICIYGLSFTG